MARTRDSFHKMARYRNSIRHIPADKLDMITGKSVNSLLYPMTFWWGIVEVNYPQQYNWKGYKQLLKIARDEGFRLQVVMSFHECGGDISLPKWIKEIGQEDSDIYFTDRDGRRSTESLTWGIDEEHVLGGRTAVEVYAGFMKSFRVNLMIFSRMTALWRLKLV